METGGSSGPTGGEELVPVKERPGISLLIVPLSVGGWADPSLQFRMHRGAFEWGLVSRCCEVHDRVGIAGLNRLKRFSEDII